MGDATKALKRLGKNVRPLRQRIRHAFCSMRKERLFARQNYRCCQSCGWAAASRELEEQRTKGMAIEGVCFYHQQDRPDWDSLPTQQIRVELLLTLVKARETGVLKRFESDYWSADWSEQPDLELRAEQELVRICGGSRDEAARLRAAQRGRLDGLVGLMESPTAYLRRDMERLWSNGIWLAYGTADNDLKPKAEARATIAIGETIVDCLSRHDVEAIWDGSPHRRILIPLMQDAVAKPKKRYRRRAR